MTQVHVEPPPIPIINIKHDNKSDKDILKLKKFRDLTSEKLDLYEFKMTLIENGDPEGVLLFFRNFNMTLAAWEVLATDAKVNYMCDLFCGEALLRFELLYVDVEGTNPLTMKNIILGLDFYFFPMNLLSKKKRAMRLGMRKPRGLKVRR